MVRYSLCVSTRSFVVKTRQYSTQPKMFYTTTWRIENFVMCPHRVNEALVSPAFSLPQLSNTQWKLMLYPRGDRVFPDGNYVSFHIERNYDDRKTKFYALATIVNTDPSASRKIKINDHFLYAGSDLCSGHCKFISRKELYRNTEGFLPNDVLTVQFHILPIVDEAILKNLPPAEDVFSSDSPNLNFTEEDYYEKGGGDVDVSLNHSSFLTRIPVERRMLDWSIRGFDAMRASNERKSAEIGAQYHRDGVNLLLTCYVENSREDAESLKLEIARKGPDLRRTFVRCEVFVSTSNMLMCSKRSEHLFCESGYRRWSFTLFRNLIPSKYFVRDGSIELKFEFLISYEPQGVEHLTRREPSSLHRTDLQKEIRQMLEYEETSDVRLECRNRKKFRAHKFLLFAKSPVFRAMFSSDTLERQTGVVRMRNTDTDTVRQLRDYLYSDSVAHLDTDDLLQLYTVADQYQMDGLKDKCSTSLKVNMDLENVCEIITVADILNDNGLKEYAKDFLVEEMDFDSDAWKTFTEQNLPLSAEIMRNCLVVTKKSLHKINQPDTEV